MNHKYLLGCLLVTAAGAANLPPESRDRLTPQEREAYTEAWGEPPSKIDAHMAPRVNAVNATWRLGLEVLGSAPRQDFRDMDSYTGFGGAIFLESDLSEAWRVQGRFEYIRYPQTSHSFVRDLIPGNGPFKPLTLSANAASVGADLHYHLPYRGLRRMYLVAGIRAIRYEFSYTTATIDPDAVTPTAVIQSSKYRTPASIGLDGGFGVDLSRRLALTGRYTYTTVSGISFATGDLGLSFRF
jgi:hypothetical protein